MKNISSQDPPLDESKEKRLRLPSPKEANGRTGESASRRYGDTAMRRCGDAATRVGRRTRRAQDFFYFQLAAPVLSRAVDVAFNEDRRERDI